MYLAGGQKEKREKESDASERQRHSAPSPGTPQITPREKTNKKTRPLARLLHEQRRSQRERVDVERARLQPLLGRGEQLGGGLQAVGHVPFACGSARGETMDAKPKKEEKKQKKN